MKVFRRHISIFLITAIVSALLPAYISGAAAAEFDSDQKVECEAGTLSNDMVTVKDAAASEGAFVWVEGGAKLDDPGALAKPDAAYMFKIPQDGKYQVWLLLCIPAGGNDSFHWRWDNDAYTEKQNAGKVSPNWQWLLVGEKELTAGKHTFSLCHREYGGKFDALFVTTDPSKVPQINAKPANPVVVTAAGGGINKQAKAFDVPDGGVLFEAEDATIGTDKVSVEKEDAASGGKTVLMVKSLQSSPPVASDKGGIEFNFTVQKEGAHTVWVRYCSLNSGSDSIFYSFNGSDYAKGDLTPVTGEGIYGWAKLYVASGLQTETPYNIRILPRESGGRIDKVIITNNTRLVPSEMGELPKPGEYTIVKLSETTYPKPTLTPPPSHPRLMFQVSDVAKIKENMNAAQNEAAIKAFRTLADQDINKGELPVPAAGHNNYNAKYLSAIEAKAFDYAINGNEQNGRQAVEAIKNYYKTIDFTGMVSILYRRQGYVIFVASEVYDWCYPLLNAEDKKMLVSCSQTMASSMEIGWPPAKQGVVTGHGSESQLMRDILSLAIASYDEYPDIYNFVAGKLLSQYIEPRNYFYASESYHQGPEYNAYRVTNDLWMRQLFLSMSGVDLYIPQAQYVLRQLLYYRRPDGQLLREGDLQETAPRDQYWSFPSAMFMGASQYGDGLLKCEYMRETPELDSFPGDNDGVTPVLWLLFNKPEVEGKSISNLALTKYFGSPNGLMVARTGWNDGKDAPDVLAFMKIGEQWAANHDHLDSGSFQIYYKGILASDSGYYRSGYGSEHHVSYAQATIAHNSLLIYDPNEKMLSNVANTGGQRRPGGEVGTFGDWMKNGYTMAKVLGHEFGPDQYAPEYSYIKGDLTKAYTNKAKQVLRSMIFMPTDDAERPAVFVVMDKVDSANPAFEKFWTFHSQQEPQIDGNVTIVKRDTDGYNGMLTNQTLYPKNAKIGKSGGNNVFSFKGKNYASSVPVPTDTSCEAGGWRIDISPSTAQATDYFLNVMYVNDADKESPLQKADLIETQQVLGTKILDRVAVFAKEAERLDTAVSFKVDGNETALKVAVAGLKEGGWKVNVNGSDMGEAVATTDGGILYFTAPAGEYKLTLVNPSALRTVAPQEITDRAAEIKLRMNGQFIYSDVSPALINDRTLVPLRVIFEKLGATITWDEATKTAVGDDGEVIVSITEGSNTAYVNGQPVELDVAATVVDGRFLVPVRFVSESLGCQVQWRQYGQIVDITPPGKKISLDSLGITDRVATVQQATCSGQSEGTLDDPLLPSYASDRNPDTLWAESGVGKWVLLELDKEYTVSGLYVLFNRASERTASFAIETSMDGKKFEKVYEGKSNIKNTGAELFEFTPVKAKYVKYIGNASDISQWNAVKELVVRVTE